MNFTWAENYPEIHKVCTLFSLSELKDAVKYAYKPVPAYIQDGPQCGLVALAMYLGNPDNSVQEIFESAKNEGFTNNGEMFSVDNMAKLAKLHSPLTDVRVYSGKLDCDEIKQMLLDGSQLLVPYDTEKDNSPGLQNGLKAHWAIICGGVETKNDFYVFARHGKVKNVAIWKLSDLSNSNAQLNVVGKYQKQPNILFNIPEGGIAGPLGLKCKSVLLRS